MIGGPRGMLEQEVSKPRSVSRTLGRLAGYFKPYWAALIGVVVLMLVNAWVQVITPELLGQAVDCYLTPAVTSALRSDENALSALQDATPQNGMSSPVERSSFACWFGTVPADAPAADFMAGLGRLVLGLIAFFVVGALTGGAMFFLMSWAGNHVLRTLQVEVFARLQQLSLSFYSRNESGDLMSRITNDVSTIQQAIGFALIQVLSGVLLLVWIAWNMVALNWAYALLSLAVMPLMAVATVWFSSQARKAFRVTRKELGNVNAELEESISGVREVQAFSREEANIESFRASNAANRDANLRAVAYTAALAPTLEALGYAAIAIVAGIGGIFLLQGWTLGGAAMTLGLIVAFIGYVQRFNQPIAQIAVLWTNIQSAVAGAERIFDLLDQTPEIVEKTDARPMPPIQGRVEFRDVWAEYKAGEPVLKGVNLLAEPGQTIAIVGPTGAGKTTLVNLLPRFYDVTRGAVLIDGIDVRDVKLDTLRRQIGMVLQDTYLFSDTVMNNIRYGRPEATDEEVMAAARLARAHEFIERLPDGYNTVLGERGAGLSQGQRQLLAIARAALANPRLLILDEATSSVDTRTERQIQAALEQLLADRTSFVIAHRLSTIRNADLVLVLVNGEIIERGTHDELLAQQGFYYNLYMSQFRRQKQVARASQRSEDGRPALSPVPGTT
ncbi:MULTISPECIES: ABC transporter ATP-binding protein [Caldilinea]|uniref:Putative ABC transporter n=1 Tax=Caldilinea aerophila (strain DSM 14535 / JCM 11387 / NBRC 104270 / STL-6-O1) TaxID=926550 RepID=I0I4T5_CALAS|nr:MULTISPECIES: ABC transporter ATP-binding protein [Caldilinea]BAM00273.1 putative ABC transporter [Caldilinea aerophila DSM 14535 = NBRC 104270]GIV71631.1 MAG: ABC transporter [Caldilinea sp.]